MPNTSPDPTSAIVQGGIGLIESAVGLINAGKTKREAERLARERPQYEISREVGQNLSLAKSDLANGMGSAAEAAYRDLDNSQFSASLGAILKGGGGVNSIGAIYGNNQEGRLRLTQMKDQLRLNQIQNLLKTSERQQEEEQTKWQINKYAPWADAASANAEARKNAQSQIWGGLNTVGSAAINYSQAADENNKFNEMNRVYGNNFPIDRGSTTSGMPISTSQYPSAGNLPPINQPKYQGWQGIPYQYQ